jgi:anti-sigma-K factor RskA
VEQDRLHELSAAYALDALDADEEHAFEEHLATCRECRADVLAFRETAGALAFDATGPAPPPRLRNRILQEARAERPNVVTLRRRWALPTAATLAAAATIAAIGLGIWAGSLHSQLGDERAAAAEVRTLVGADGSLVVARSGDAALVVRKLGPPPPGKTYEAWVIEAGTPRPAGTFTASGGRTAFGLTRPVPTGAIVAVTVEPAGGRNRPTTTPIFRSTPA